MPPREVKAVSSLFRGRPPRAGVLAPHYRWRDIMEGPPPRRSRKGEGAYVVYEGIEVGRDLRLAFATIVSVDPGTDLADASDDIITVDARVTVQPRAFLTLLDRERRTMDAWATRWRWRVARVVAMQQRGVRDIAPPWWVPLGMALVRLEGKLLQGIVGGVRQGARSAVELPDNVLSRAVDARSHLEGRGARRDIWVGLRDPAKLSNPQKGVLLTLSAAALLATVFILNSILVLFAPGIATQYRAFLSDGFTSVLATVALPIPLEPLLIFSTLTNGAAQALTAILLGKMIGAWMLYLVGDSLNDAIASKTAGRPRVARVVESLKRGADRFGFLLLIAFNALPLIPDTLIYVFAVSGMRFRSYFAGIAVGSALKLGGIVLAIHLVGPARVAEFFS